MMLLSRLEEGRCFVDDRKGQILGYLFAVLQAVFYSTMGIFGKLLYATGMNAQEAVILRFLCTTLLLGAFMLVWRKEPLVSKQKAVYIQAVFYFASAFIYFFAVERMNAGIATVLFYLYPVMVAVMNMVMFKEKLALSTMVALVVTITGLVFISGILSGALVIDPVGILFSFLSALAFAAYTIAIQITGRTEGSFTVTFTLSWTSLVASCVIFAPSVPTMFSLTPYQIAIGCTIAFVNTILPVVLYIQAVKYIGGTKSSLISISETPFSLVFAFIILGETLTITDCIGIVLVMIGIVIVTVAPIRKAADKGPGEPSGVARKGK